MKKRMLTAIGLSAMIAVSLAGCSTSVSVPDTVRVENVGDSADGKITMDGSETVKIVPDMAKIVFAVTSEAKKADECQQKNTEALNSLTEYLKGQGIDEKSITTSGYSLNPRYDWSSDTRKLIGYEMQTEVTVSDVTVEQVGTLLSGGVNAGANEIYSVSYYSSGYDDAYAEALKKAVELARTKAQALAEASGRTLGDVVSIEEYSDNQYGRYIDGGVNLQKESVSMAAGAENTVEDMNVMPGEMEVDANIKIVFSMVD
ncbi:DUF541 domain-containing protein [Clostridium sp. OF09-10]|nr:SIMPL domain-containing protein [Clostridium sp. OF09-10]RHW01308.1 DUF541 domain-containing protein [Clostridium sp. OF09-10]